MSDQGELLADNTTEAALLIAAASEEELSLDRWPRQLAAIVDVTRDVFMRRGHSPEAAFEEAREVVLSLALYFGGRPVYLPKAVVLEAGLTHAKIWHEFRGNNTEALADRYGLTLRQVQKVIKRQGEYRRGLRQHRLFTEEGEKV